jgi:hypothetical protein
VATRPRLPLSRAGCGHFRGVILWRLRATALPRTHKCEEERGDANGAVHRTRHRHDATSRSPVFVRSAAEGGAVTGAVSGGAAQSAGAEHQEHDPCGSTDSRVTPVEVAVGRSDMYDGAGDTSGEARRVGVHLSAAVPRAAGLVIGDISQPLLVLRLAERRRLRRLWRGQNRRYAGWLSRLAGGDPRLVLTAVDGGDGSVGSGACHCLLVGVGSDRCARLAVGGTRRVWANGPG